MRALRPLLFAAIACFAVCILPFLAVAQSDDAIAEHVLGTRWKQLSRRAGMIFAGTVLSAPGTLTSTTATTDRTLLAVELSFRVDQPIAGVEQGQVVTIHEWVGALSLQRPMRRGERILIFLYAPSRLGLTSPVDGSRGQIALDASGQNVQREATSPFDVGSGQSSASFAGLKSANAPVTVVQLERAIRAARGE
jgi:hypothetical protein